MIYSSKGDTYLEEVLKMRNKKRNDPGNIKCECGYQNHKNMVEIYGTCRGCGKVLDSKAKYRHEMYVRLHLWRKKR
jgi:hypothetical protein